MADKKTEEDPKPEEKAEDTKKDSKATKQAPSGSLAPNEDKSLPQGIYGGPATANNPARANVVFKDKLEK